MVSTTGKIAVITGGSAGIDLATAKQSDLEGFPLSSGRAGRGLRIRVALGAVIVTAGLGLCQFYGDAGQAVGGAAAQRRGGDAGASERR
jgi:hypothetical protein